MEAIWSKPCKQGTTSSDERDNGEAHKWPLASNFDTVGGREALSRDGFHRFKHFLAVKDLSVLRAAFDNRLGWTESEHPQKMKELACSWRWDDPAAAPFLQVLLDERLLDFLSVVCGFPFAVISLDLFGKVPLSETWIPWHQDTYTGLTGFAWTEEKTLETRTGKHAYPVTLTVALDDVSCENGGLEFVPGRHGELLSHFHPSKSRVPEYAIVDDKRVEYRLDAGTAGVHHPLAPHRSCPNVSSRTRRVFSFQISPWTDRIESLCGSPTEAHNCAVASAWPEWQSKPEGRYLWTPGNEKTLQDGPHVCRLLLCWGGLSNNVDCSAH